MRRKRNNPQRKEQENSPEKEMNEKDIINLSKTEFKIMMVKMFNTMRKDIVTMKTEIKNDIVQIKNTLEGIYSTLSEAEDRNSELEDRVEKNHSIKELNK